MVWTVENSQGNEAAKIAPFIVPYTRGKVLDIGCGANKAYPHFIGVDNHKDAHLFGVDMSHVDVRAEADDLSMFADGSMDAVFSAHMLEHYDDTEKVLREWWRVIKPGGHLVLYLPHKDLYPNIGEHGANPDHKHDFMPGDIVEIMRKVGKSGWVLVENEDRDQDNEYSFYQVYRKTKTHKCIEDPWRKPDKACLVVRYGAYGDQIMASSVLPLLKAEGWHITYQCDPRGFEVMEHNPYVDAFWLQEKDQVPNHLLHVYWAAMATRFDRVINLSSSIEWTLLPVYTVIGFYYDPQARHRIYNVNYLERTHDIANVPYEFDVRFYDTPEERKWAKIMRKKLAGDRPAVMVCLTGSSMHKRWSKWHTLIPWLLERTNATIFMVGDSACQILEEDVVEHAAKYFGNSDAEITEAAKGGALETYKMVTEALGEDRLKFTSGVWSIRETMAFAKVCDVVIGPETGVMNAVCMEDNRKVVLLSHSSVENLTKHWKNTISLTTDGCSKSPGVPCHQMHHTPDTCVIDQDTGDAECMSRISTNEAYTAVVQGLPASAQAQAAQ